MRRTWMAVATTLNPAKSDLLPIRRATRHESLGSVLVTARLWTWNSCHRLNPRHGGVTQSSTCGTHGSQTLAAAFS